MSNPMLRSCAALCTLLQVLQAQGAYAPLPIRNPELGTHAVRALELADLDGDGTLEIVLGTSAGVLLWKRHDRRYFQTGPPLGASVRSLHLGDREGDGDLDILRWSLGTVDWLVNDGAGRFRAAPAEGVHAILDGSLLLGDLGGTPAPEIVHVGTSGCAIYAPDARGYYSSTGLSWPNLGIVDAAFLADLDSDGKRDFVTLHRNGVAFGIQSGTHWKWQRFPDVWSVGGRGVLRDLDRDGRPELVIATPRGIESLSLGKNGLRRRLHHASPSRMFEVLDALDLDGDRILDLLTINDRLWQRNGGVPSVLPLLGDGSGSFRVGGPEYSPLRLRSAPDAFSRSGDLDNDGDEDWIVCEKHQTNKVLPTTTRIFLREEGRLVESTGDPYGGPLYGWPGVGDATGTVNSIADLDQDGLPELVNSDGLVMSRDASGGFLLRRLDFLKSTRTRVLFPLRLNTDSAPDLVAIEDDSTIRTWLNDGKGAFRPCGALSQRVSQPWFRIPPVGDLDGDGDDDLLVTDPWGVYTVFLSDGAGGLEAAPKLVPEIPELPVSVQAEDLDRDGDLDLVVATMRLFSVSRPIRILQNQRGRFQDVTERVLPPLAGFVGLFPQVQVADFDRDGHLDLVLVGEVSSLHWLRGSASGVFSEAAHTPLTDHALRILACDLDHDLVPELIVGGDSGLVVYQFRNGAFQRASRLFEVNQQRVPFPLALLDWDGDGDDDLVIEDGWTTAPRFFNVLYGRERHLWSGVTPRAGSRWDLCFDAEPGYAKAPRLAIPIFGTKLTRVAIPPLGTLLVDPHASVVLSPLSIPAPKGSAQLGLDIPPLPALVGTHFHAQALIVDLVAGARFTNVLSERIR